MRHKIHQRTRDTRRSTYSQMLNDNTQVILLHTKLIISWLGQNSPMWQDRFPYIAIIWLGQNSPMWQDRFPYIAIT